MEQAARITKYILPVHRKARRQTYEDYPPDPRSGNGRVQPLVSWPAYFQDCPSLLTV
jgi:hypothetical protein